MRRRFGRTTRRVSSFAPTLDIVRHRRSEVHPTRAHELACVSRAGDEALVSPRYVERREARPRSVHLELSRREHRGSRLEHPQRFFHGDVLRRLLERGRTCPSSCALVARPLQAGVGAHAFGFTDATHLATERTSAPGRRRDGRCRRLTIAVAATSRVSRECGAADQRRRISKKRQSPPPMARPSSCGEATRSVLVLAHTAVVRARRAG